MRLQEQRAAQLLQSVDQMPVEELSIAISEPDFHELPDEVQTALSDALLAMKLPESSRFQKWLRLGP